MLSHLSSHTFTYNDLSSSLDRSTASIASPSRLATILTGTRIPTSIRTSRYLSVLNHQPDIP
ncbi:hypothetical protein B0T12DRAFT_140341 [Alternaria alternata]|nr:hypothetical protein B0T12DRAFT_140341 [Alternaria alternata]